MVLLHALTNALPFLLAPAPAMFAVLVGIFPWVVVLALWLTSRHDFFAAPGPRTAAMSSAS